MQQRILTIFLFVVFLASCATKDLSKDLADPVAKRQEFVNDITITAVLEQRNIPKDSDLKALHWEAGLETGMKGVLNAFVKQHPIFAPFVDRGSLYVKPLIRSDLYAAPTLNAVTGDYENDYRITGTFVPDIKLAGRVTGLTAKHTIGGANDEVYLQFHSEEYLQSPSYFLIASLPPVPQGRNLQVFGSGKITQIVGKRGQGIILETTKEVEEGDAIFLVQVKGETLSKGQPIEKPKPVKEEDVRSGPDEVVVEPATEPESIAEEQKQKEETK